MTPFGLTVIRNSRENGGEPGQDDDPNPYQKPCQADTDVDDEAVPEPDRQ